MGIKEQISSSYMDEMKARYGDLLLLASDNVFITGAWNEGSIGKVIADLLRKDGMDVEVAPKEFDVRSPFYGLGNFDTLIMCHGIMNLDWVENTTAQTNFDIVNVNLIGSMNLVSSFVRTTINMVPVRKKIISIGSMAYKAVLNGSAAYCASKAGLAHYMKCVAWELAPKGYDVYSIHPSNTEDANMSRETIRGLMRYRDMTHEEATAYWSANNPRNAFLSKEEIANLVQFICSGKAPYLSGSNLELAGGQR